MYGKQSACLFGGVVNILRREQIHMCVVHINGKV